MNLIPRTSSLETTPTITLQHTPLTTPIELTQHKPSTIPFPDTEFNLTPFDIIATHSPPHPLDHNPDFSDIDPTRLSNIKKRKPTFSILIPTFIRPRRRHSRLDLLFQLRNHPGSLFCS